MKAKTCLTASAFLIHEDKVLLVKHKKFKQWLGPGGHIDANERPHEAAEREFLEETGLVVKVLSETPIAVNEHWVCQENYKRRLEASKNQTQFVPDQLWQKGCEKHFNFLYLVKLAGPLHIKPQEGESEELAWFSLADLQGRFKGELAETILAEAKLAFDIVNKSSSRHHQLTDQVKLLQKAAIIRRLKVNSEPEVLLLQRSAEALSRPNCFDLPGGNSEWPELNSSMADLHQADIVREIFEETALQVAPEKFSTDKLTHFSTYFDSEKQIFTVIVGWLVDFFAIKFEANQAQEANIQISNEHQNYLWARESDLTKYDFGGASGAFVLNIILQAFAKLRST